MDRALVVPSLTTRRVHLEALSLAHSAGIFAMWSRQEVCRYSGAAADVDGRPIPLPAADASASDRIIDFFVKGAVEGTRFRWAVLNRSEHAFIGAVGFNALGACSEIAYHMQPDFWGHGFMTEAARAAVDWLRCRRECVSIEAFIDPDNVSSIRLAQRLGLRATGAMVDGSERYAALLASPDGEAASDPRR